MKLPDLSLYAIEDCELQSLEVNHQKNSLTMILRCPDAHWRTRRSFLRFINFFRTAKDSIRESKVSLNFIDVTNLSGSLIDPVSRTPINSLNDEGSQILSAVDFSKRDELRSTARFDFIDGTIEFDFCGHTSTRSPWIDP